MQYPPLFEIETHHIIPDELHLLLRVMDILIRNLVLTMVAADNTAKRDAQPCDNISKMKKSVKECGIPFSIWELKDADGRNSGRYEFTALKGERRKSY